MERLTLNTVSDEIGEMAVAFFVNVCQCSAANRFVSKMPRTRIMGPAVCACVCVCVCGDVCGQAASIGLLRLSVRPMRFDAYFPSERNTFFGFYV